MVPNGLKSVLRQFNLIRPATEGRVFAAMDKLAQQGPFAKDAFMFQLNKDLASAVAQFKAQPKIPGPPLPKALRHDPVAQVVWSRSLAGREAFAKMVTAPKSQAVELADTVRTVLGLPLGGGGPARALPAAPKVNMAAGMRAMLQRQRLAMGDRLFGRKDILADRQTRDELLLNFAERKISIQAPASLSDRDKALWAADPLAAEILAARHQGVPGPQLPAGVSAEAALESIEASLLHKINRG